MYDMILYISSFLIKIYSYRKFYVHLVKKNKMREIEKERGNKGRESKRKKRRRKDCILQPYSKFLAKFLQFCPNKNLVLVNAFLRYIYNAALALK